MCKGLMGKKLGMTGLFLPDGQYVPVTVIEAGPCVVTQIKTAETDGYNALQLGFGKKKESRVNKPLKGHFRKAIPGLFIMLKNLRLPTRANTAWGSKFPWRCLKSENGWMSSGQRKDVALRV